ncbi:MAG: hypothetical protein HYR93_07095 [Chloroflexi bacterium]|nr:hypothetical protein [Chloroflexota bacterium]
MTTKDKSALNQPKSKLEALREQPTLAMTAFLVLQMILGFEWLWSGLGKVIMSGGFPAALPGQLEAMMDGAPAWYANFLSGFVIPNSTLFAYVIEYAEILIGIAFLFGPLIWFFVWNRMPGFIKSALFSLTAAAAIGGFFMAVNFHFAAGAAHPWLLPTDGLEESVDFDSMVAAMQIVIAWVYIVAFGYLRQETLASGRIASSVKQAPAA